MKCGSPFKGNAVSQCRYLREGRLELTTHFTKDIQTEPNKTSEGSIFNNYINNCVIGEKDGSQIECLIKTSGSDIHVHSTAYCGYNNKGKCDSYMNFYSDKTFETKQLTFNNDFDRDPNITELAHIKPDETHEITCNVSFDSKK